MLRHLVQIRRFVESDTEAVWSLHRRALAHVGALGPSGSWEEDLRDIRHSYLACGDFLVGTIQQAVVSMGAWRFLGANRAELKRMRVEPIFQGRGLGRQMLETLEASALARGIEMLELETTTTQTGAQRLYETGGYRMTDASQAHGYDVLRYVKNLRVDAEFKSHGSNALRFSL